MDPLPVGLPLLGGRGGVRTACHRPPGLEALDLQVCSKTAAHHNITNVYGASTPGPTDGPDLLLPAGLGRGEDFDLVSGLRLLPSAILEGALWWGLRGMHSSNQMRGRHEGQ